MRETNTHDDLFEVHANVEYAFRLRERSACVSLAIRSVASREARATFSASSAPLARLGRRRDLSSPRRAGPVSHRMANPVRDRTRKF